MSEAWLNLPKDECTEPKIYAYISYRVIG